MKHYLFEITSGEHEGEEFIVCANSLTEAHEFAEAIADGAQVRYGCRLSEFEAESSGLDEY